MPSATSTSVWNRHHARRSSRAGISVSNVAIAASSRLMRRLSRAAPVPDRKRQERLCRRRLTSGGCQEPSSRYSSRFAPEPFMSQTPLAAFVALLAFAAAPAQGITLEQAMADPDWIGPPVQHPYWSVDGQSVYYSLKQKGTQVRDLHRVGVAAGSDTIVGPESMPAADGADAVFDRAHARAAFVRNGDVFIRDVASGRLTQDTRTPQKESAPQF